MRVLLTGATGLLGTWLRRTAPSDVDVVAVTHRRRLPGPEVVADLRDRDAVKAAFGAAGPSLVIHAGYAKDEASIVDATDNVVAAAEKHDAHVVFISSEAVFSGDGVPRGETDRPDPIWDYGRWKADAEAIVERSGEHSTIVRLPLIVSVDPEDHIITSIRSGADGGDAPVWFTDEMRQPAHADELARAIWQIAALPQDDRTGTWHLPGAERLSRYEIASRGGSFLGIDGETIVGAPTPRGARRPRNLNLAGERARRQIDWDPSPIHTTRRPSSDRSGRRPS